MRDSAGVRYRMAVRVIVGGRDAQSRRGQEETAGGATGECESRACLGVGLHASVDTLPRRRAALTHPSTGVHHGGESMVAARSCMGPPCLQVTSQPDRVACLVVGARTVWGTYCDSRSRPSLSIATTGHSPVGVSLRLPIVVHSAIKGCPCSACHGAQRAPEHGARRVCPWC